MCIVVFEMCVYLQHVKYYVVNVYYSACYVCLYHTQVR